MIFDDYDSSMSSLNDKENTPNYLNVPKKKLKIKTSLDDIIEEKKIPLKNKNISNLYSTFKLTINKKFFQNQNNPSIVSIESFTKNPNLQIKKNFRDITKSTKKNSHTFNDLQSFEKFSSLKDEKKSNFESQGNSIFFENEKMKKKLNRNYSKTINCINFANNLKIENKKIFSNSLSNINLRKKREKKIASFFSFKFKDFSDNEFIEKEICKFCKGMFKLNDTLAKTNSCGHIFHKLCFDNWISQKSLEFTLKCPLCNFTI